MSGAHPEWPPRGQAVMSGRAASDPRESVQHDLNLQVPLPGTLLGRKRRTRASGLAAIQGVLVRNKDDGSVFFFLFFKQKKKISLKIFVVVVKKKLFLLLSLE